MRGALWSGLWPVCLAGAAAVFVVLIGINITLHLGNRTLQGEVTTRQQFIQQTIALENLNREIVTAIADLSVRNKDEALKTILTEQGITFSASPNVAPPVAGASAPTAAGGPRK